MSTYSTLFSEQIGSSNEIIQALIEYNQDFNGDGLNDVKVTLSIAPQSNSGTEDMIGVAFDIQNHVVSGLTIKNITKSTSNGTLSTYNPTYVIGANKISDNPGAINPGFNTSGGGSDEPYDIGIKFSEQGAGEGIVQSASFLITGNTNLDAATLLNNTNWYVRVQSTDGGTSSAKTGGFIDEITEPPPVITYNPAVSIDKVTNGADGLTILAGSAITWTYTVTNVGDVALNNVTLTDDQGEIPVLVSGDTNANGLLDLTETWVYQATGVAIAGGYSNIGTVNTGNTGNSTIVTDSDSSNYFGANPSFDLEKYVSVDGGVTFVDADTAPGAYLDDNSYNPIFKFVVTNTGNVALSNITLSDNKFDLNGAQAGTSIEIASLGVNGVFETTFVAPWEAGQHTNTAVINAVYTDNVGNQKSLTDSDDANYFGVKPAVNIDKVTNGADGLTILTGSPITWTYTITNIGNIGLKNVNLTDDQGEVPVLVGGDTNSDGVLDLNETWIYQATGVAIAGGYSNIGTVTAGNVVTSKVVTDNDSSNYFGANPSFDLEKYVSVDNGVTFLDADTAPGAYLKENTYQPIFKFVVTNTGNVDLANITLSDNKFDLNGAQAGTSIQIASLGVNGVFETTFVAPWEAGQHTSTAVIDAIYTDSIGNQKSLTDSDNANYYGDVIPTMEVSKTSNILSFREDIGATATYTITITNTSNPNSADLDPLTITSLPDTLWFDKSGDGLKQSSELQTVDLISNALAQWQAAGNTGNIVIAPGQSFSFNYNVVYQGNNLYNPWEDPTNTIVVNAQDNENNQITDQDSVKIDIIQKNQRSIQLDSLTGVRNGGTITGNVRITDASSDASIVDVLLDSFNVNYQEKVQNKWVKTSEAYTNKFWVDSNANGILDGSESFLTDLNPSTAKFDTAVVFDSTVSIGYQTTFLDGTAPNPLKATFETTINGRYEQSTGIQRIFTISNTF